MINELDIAFVVLSLPLQGHTIHCVINCYVITGRKQREWETQSPSRDCVLNIMYELIIFYDPKNWYNAYIVVTNCSCAPSSVDLVLCPSLFHNARNKQQQNIIRRAWTVDHSSIYESNICPPWIAPTDIKFFSYPEFVLMIAVFASIHTWKTRCKIYLLSPSDTASHLLKYELNCNVTRKNTFVGFRRIITQVCFMYGEIN